MRAKVRPLFAGARRLLSATHKPGRRSRAPTLYSFGWFVLPFLLVFKSATLNNIIVEGVNGAWPRFELAAHRDAALNAGAASLDAIRAPNVLVSAPNSEIAPWMQRKLADALAAENQALGDSARVRFSNCGHGSAPAGL
jgi:hypothetical protein